MFRRTTRLAKEAYGMTIEAAHSRGICIRCQEPALVQIDGETQHNPELFYSPAGMKEWNISAMCEKCFDNMFAFIEEEPVNESP